MSKYTLFALALTVILGGAGFASSAAAATPEMTDAGFVCPVIKTDGVLNADNGNGVHTGDFGDGTYTVAPDGGAQHSLTVPLHATNGDGEGSPGPGQSAPGDTDYTAIWSGQ